MMAERRIVGEFQEVILGSETESQEKGGGLSGLSLMSPNEHLQGSSYPPDC